MSTQKLTDKNNITIGYIETQSDGRQKLTEKNNITKGYYDPKTNRTTDKNNIGIGTGNLLATLLSH